MGGISESKRHGGVLVEAEGSDYCGFGDVDGGDGDLMIAFDKFELGEHSGTPEVVGEVLDVREGIAIRGGDSNEAAVVTAGAPATDMLRHHVEGGCPRTVRTADDASGLEL